MQPADDGGAARADRSRQLRRYGPLAAIVVLLVVVAAVVVVGGGDDDGGGDGGSAESAEATGDLSWSEIGDAAPGAPDPIGDMPVTYAEADEAGDVDAHEWPDTCDTARGTVTLPSVYAPPCVPAFDGDDGDNGGATATGVTADTIKVVYYVPEPGADLDALLVSMGVNDAPDERVETFEQYVEIGSSVAQTYGRQVEVVKFEASGTDVTASRADAIDVIAMDPFAVINGPGLDRGTFAQEVTDAGILCFGCGGVLPDQMVLDMAPYAWASLPSPDQFLGMLGAWVDAAAEADPENVAEFAGGDIEGEPRKIGVIHFEQDPPIFGDTGEAQEERFQDVAITESYLFDLATMPAKATELMAEYKSEGITTVVFLGDPIMPGYLTNAATELEYFPEWLFTGTALTDTNVLARDWNPDQMVHAFGMSQLPAPAEQDLQAPITLYRWYFGGDDALPPARNQYALMAAPAGWLVAGIHMAGPELTAETFARGLFRMPPAGGGPANPQVSYGNWGVFPAMDYQAVDDAVEIWWDPDVEAEDERGEVGRGVWRRSNGAARFTIEDAPEPKPFTDAENAVTVLDELSDEDTPPDYPPPAGSPAAG